MEGSLVSRFLHRGESVRIGRHSACEVVVNCPNVSSLHCEVGVSEQLEVGGAISCFVRDLSSNGTWIIRSAHGNEGRVASRPKKLSKGAKEDLYPGDHILVTISCC